MNEKSETTETTIDFKVEKQTAIAKIDSISGDCTTLVEYGLEISVDTPETLEIANQKLSEAKELIDMTEEVRKAFVKGPNEFVKEVNTYAKAFLEPVDNMVTYLKDQAKSYQELQIATLRLEQERQANELTEQHGKEKEDLKKLSRAAVQIHARIHGGSYKTGSGEIKSSAGCITTKQCEDLREFLKTKYPEHESFGSYADKSRELMGKFISAINDMEKNLKLSDSSDEKTVEKAAKAILKAKGKSEKLVIAEFEKLGTVIIKAAEKEERESKKIIAGASKGIRKTIIWEVTEPEKIPRAYLVIDEEKVNELLSRQREEIRSLIEQDSGGTVIAGIEFSIKTTHVSA